MKYAYNKIKSGLSSPLPEEITIIEICKYMGWSWQELMNTPVNIVNTVLVKMSLESQK